MFILSKHPFTPLFSLIAFSALGVGKISAESISWNGISSNAFSNAGNWTGANTPPQSDDSLVFGTLGAGTLNNDLTNPAFNIAGITFSAGAGTFMIGGNAFTLTGDVTNNSANLQTIHSPITLSEGRTFTTTAGGGNITLGGILDGSGSLMVAGGGTLTLTGMNTYGGGTSISSGAKLQLGAGGATGSLTGAITNHGTFVFNRSDDYTFSGVISGNGGVTQNGGIVRFTERQLYTGPTQINAGTFVLPTTLDHGISNFTVVTIASGGRLDLSNRRQEIAGLAGAGAVYSFGGNAGSLTLTLASNQTLNFSGSLGLPSDSNLFSLDLYGYGTQILTGVNHYTGATRLYGGTLQLGNGGTTGSLSESSSITINDAILAFNRSDTVTQGTDFSTAGINGIGRLFQRGSGTLILNAANTYTGGTVIESGTLQLGDGGATGSIAGNVLNHGTLAFRRSDDFTFSGIIDGTGNVVNNGGIVRFYHRQYYTGQTIVNAGTLVLTGGGDQAISALSLVTVATGARLDFSNRSLKLPGLVGGGQVYSFGGSAGALELSISAGQTHHFWGGLGGPDPEFSFTKSGVGTQVLSGANTYTGSTSVNGGTLRLEFGAVSSNILSSSSSLVMGGGTIVLTGAGTQTLNGLTTSAGTSSSILLDANQTLTLGSLISAGSGSSLLFDTSAGGANANTSSVGSAIVLLAGQTEGVVINPGFTVADAGGFGYATVNELNQVIRMTTGTPLLPTSGGLSSTAYTVDNHIGGPTEAGSSTLTLTASMAAGGILVDTTAAAGTLTLGGGVVLSTNVWNFNGVGSNAYTITGGAGLTAITAGDQITVNNYNSGAVTFASPILANGVNTLVVNGTGTTILTGATAHNGGTIVNGGTLKFNGVQAAPLRGRAGFAGSAGSVGPGGPGGISVVLNRTATLFSALDIVGGIGGDGASGYTGADRNTQTPGGAGGSGGTGILAETSGSLTITNATGGAGGNGGQGASNIDYEFYRSQAPAGGAGGAGGTGVIISNASSLSASGSITGGAGGRGGPGGVGFRNSTTGHGGAGGAGGTGLDVRTNLSLGLYMVSGGAGGSGGYAGVNAVGFAAGDGPTGVSGSGGAGGIGINAANGIALALSANAIVKGGAAGAGTNGVGATYSVSFPGLGGNAGSGGAGGAGVSFTSGGSLNNLGTISGGNGANGGNGAPNTNFAGNGGKGGDGGAGVRFVSGGSLSNSGTITGGVAGSGGAAGVSQTYGRNGLPGTAGSNGNGVVFTGGPGTLSNLNGGVINGGVVMDDFANEVTLETGSTISGVLDMGTRASSTLTLTGSGSQVWSAAVTGTTSFAGSLSKEGNGAWELDQAFLSNHTTRVNAGTLRVNAFLAGETTVGNDATLGGAGHFGGDVIVRSGGTLSPGNSPGQMTIESNLIMENGSLLLMEFGGSSIGLFDQLDVQGSFTADGTLSLMLIDGFTPEVGEMFTIFNGTTPGYDSGSFHLTTNLGGGLYWDTSALASFGIVTVAIPEPSTYVLLGFGALIGILAPRSTRKRM